MILVQISKQSFLERRNSSLFNCNYDSFGNEFCPSNLAKAESYWDYENGYAVSGVGQVVDYTKKETNTSYTNKTSSTETAPLDAVQIVTGSRAGSYAQWNKTSTANQRAYVMWVAGKNGPECWNGWKPWENFSKYDEDMHKYRDNYYHKIDNSRCEYYLGTYNIYGIKYICPPSAQDWDWEVDETAGNCKRVVVVCPQGYTETMGAEVSKGECKKNVTICPQGYTETVGIEVAKGECKGNIDYSYYEYKCNEDKNGQNNNYQIINNGGDCNKSDTNNKTVNPELSNSCNSSIPPTNNCKRLSFTCNSNEMKPAFVDGEWKCSPFMCDGKMKCGYGTCDLPSKPSLDKYQDVAYNPLQYITNNQCNGEICDYTINAKVSYCESLQCPKGDDIIQDSGKCYKLECPKGTHISGDKCIKSNY